MGKSRIGVNKIMENILKYDSVVESVYQLLLQVSRSVNHSKKVDVNEKGRADFVTNIDVNVERKLIQGLQEVENIPCLAEESYHFIDYSNYWTIDPIDGTTNYIHGYPSYCVSVAKIKDNVTKYGFVYNLATKELFLGIKGEGAYLINTRKATQQEIKVSGTKHLRDGLIAFGCPYDKSKTDRLFRSANKILKSCHDLKRNGPASLDICYVACGRFDGYFELDLKEWDYKAAKMILEEAGGELTNWQGDNIRKGSSNVLASNKNIHQHLLSCLDNNI